MRKGQTFRRKKTQPFILGGKEKRKSCVKREHKRVERTESF